MANKIYSNADFIEFNKNSSQQKDNLAYGFNYGIYHNDKNNFNYGIRSEKRITRILQETIKEFNSNFIKDIYFSKQELLFLKIHATAPYISGLGKQHVTETGIELHHTLGVPYIKGSAIKGMLRAWCEEAGIKERHIDLLFGTTDKDGNESTQGALVFHDVLFDNLVVYPDIMTPHDEDTRGYLKSVNPISFARVEFLSDTYMIISIRSGIDKELIDLQVVGKWIIQALKEYGLGAKTAIGYGRFDGSIDNKIGDILNKKKEEAMKIQREQIAKEAEKTRRANLSPEELALEDALDNINIAKDIDHPDRQFILDNKIKQTEFMDEFKDNIKVIDALYQFYEEEGYFKKKKGKIKVKADHLKELYERLHQ